VHDGGLGTDRYPFCCSKEWSPTSCGPNSSDHCRSNTIESKRRERKRYSHCWTVLTEGIPYAKKDYNQIVHWKLQHSACRLLTVYVLFTVRFIVCSQWLNCNRWWNCTSVVLYLWGNWNTLQPWLFPYHSGQEWWRLTGLQRWINKSIWKSRPSSLAMRGNKSREGIDMQVGNISIFR